MTRTRPFSSTTLKALLGFLVAITFGSVRDLVWEDLREGRLDLRQMSRGARGLVLTGLAVLVAMLGLLLFNDVLRESTPLYALPETIAGRGSAVPTALMPIVLLVLTLGWTFLLLGALRSHWVLCLGVVLYCLSGIGTWLMLSLVGSLSVSGDTTQLVQVMLASVSTLGIPVIVLLRRRRPPRPLLEFGLILACLTATYAITQTANITNWRNFGSPLVFSSFAFTIESITLIAIPLLLTVGIDMANFARTASTWLSRAVSERLPPALAYVALAGLSIACLWRVLSDGMAEFEVRAPAVLGREYLGAAVLIGAALGACALMLALGRMGQERHDIGGIVARSAERFAMPLILVLHMPELISLVIIQFTALFALTPSISGAMLGASTWLNNSANFYWRDLIFVLTLFAALWLARRRRVGLACYLAVLFVVHSWSALTEPGQFAASLAWNSPVTVDFWLTALIVGTGAVWLLRHQLTPVRTGLLLTCLLITALIRKTDFINNPFSPLSSAFGFGGLGFIAFGILWDAVNIGAWANKDSRALPHLSRIFLYFGYVLLTVCAVNWALTSHNLTSLNYLTGQIAASGFNQLGKPMLYAFILVSLLRPKTASPAGTATTAASATTLSPNSLE